MTESSDPKAGTLKSRRDFFAGIGIGACALTAGGAVISVLDYLEPKVLFEPPTIFKAGHAADYPEGTVRFNAEQRTYIIGSAAGVFALSAVCTHLGCITRHNPSDGVIACPCHGSVFDLQGNVLHGPAPQALPWLEVRADASGVLLVDTSVVVPHGKVLKT